MTTVLDASALLAYLQDEANAEAVETVLPESVISTVNWSEVMQKSLASGVDVNGLCEDFQALGLEILPFTPQQAETAARLWQQTRSYGLSLGDRACLSLGIEMKTPVLTADRAWLDLNLAVEVRVVR